MRRAWILSLCAGLILLVAPTVAHADVNDFTVTNFTADETLTSADKQGELHIVEHIAVNFTDYNHGILRAIPKSYKHHTLKLRINKVSSDSGAPSQYRTSSSNGNTVLKIGDPDRTVTGQQEYTIDYTVQNVVTFYSGHDELYWDVNGDQWDEPFTHVAVTVHLPVGAVDSSLAPKCYAGAFGSTNSCAITLDGSTLQASTSDLPAKHTMTYVVAFKKGYFTPATFWDNAKDYMIPVLEFAVPVLLLGLGGLFWWLKSGRDAKGRGTIIPEYAPPEGISPLDAGTIADFKVDNRDLTATFIDLARRGYIRIIEERQNQLLVKDKVTYTLELCNADWSACTPQEIQLLSAMFTSKQVGEKVGLASEKNKLYKTATALRKSVSTDLTARGFFKQNPYKFAAYGSISFSIVFLVIWFGGFMSGLGVGAPLLAGIVVGAIIFFLFVRALPARTAVGVAANEQLLGLKLYMETAEKDRMEKLEGPEAAYAAGAGEPTRTVELFEKLLPYAIVLQVEKQWAGKFNDIYTSPPAWYSGNWTAFNAGYLASSLNEGFASAINTSFSAPSSSGGSGFGGGAGGGGGGGGGGGW